MGFRIQCNALDWVVIQKGGNHGHRDRKRGEEEEPINSHTHVAAAAAAAEADVRITERCIKYAQTPPPHPPTKVL